MTDAHNIGIIRSSCVTTLPTLLYATLFCSVLFYSILFYTLYSHTNNLKLTDISYLEEINCNRLE